MTTGAIQRDSILYGFIAGAFLVALGLIVVQEIWLSGGVFITIAGVLCISWALMMLREPKQKKGPTRGAIQRENRPEHPVKKWAMKWVWRVQQIGAISTLLITAMTLAIVVSDKLKLNEVLPVTVGPLIAILILGSLVMSLGYLWDKKFQMWKEQNVVNVERNPYYVFKMTPKEVVCYTDLWFPKIGSLKAIAESQSVIARKLGLEDIAKVTDKAAVDLGQVLKEFEPWCDEQMRDDSVLAEQTKLLQEYLRDKAKG